MLLSDAIQAFGHDRRAKGIAPKTRSNELQVLRLLLADVGNISVRSLKPQHADLFWAGRSGWAPGTMNRARGTLSIFVALITRPDRRKLRETHQFVTQNGGQNATPTLPDRLHIIDQKLDALGEKFNRHIEWHLEQK